MVAMLVSYPPPKTTKASIDSLSFSKSLGITGHPRTLTAAAEKNAEALFERCEIGGVRMEI